MALKEGNQKKPPGRKKSLTLETLDIKSIHVDWDAQTEIRDRLRSGEHLMATSETAGEDIAVAVKNIEVLQPFITRMSLTETRPLPAIDHLRSEIEMCYVKNKRGESPEDMPDVVGMGWRIRKLLGFVKMKVRRSEVSTAPFMQICSLEKSMYHHGA